MPEAEHTSQGGIVGNQSSDCADDLGVATTSGTSSGSLEGLGT